MLGNYSHNSHINSVKTTTILLYQKKLLQRTYFDVKNVFEFHWLDLQKGVEADAEM